MATAGEPKAASRPTVVLVHGGFVDGSGWEDVYKILKKDGYTVAIVQNPTISLTGDVAATRHILAAQNGPVIVAVGPYQVSRTDDLRSTVHRVPQLGAA